MKKRSILIVIFLITFCTTINCTNNYTEQESEATSTITLLDGVKTSWDGAELINYPTGKPSITMLKITVAPKSKLPLHYHPVINVGYMLEGSLTVTDDKGNTTVINAGDPIVETVNTIHYGENMGDTDAVILVFYAGEEGENITIKSDSVN